MFTLPKKCQRQDEAAEGVWTFCVRTTVLLAIALITLSFDIHAQAHLGQSAADRAQRERDARYRRAEPDADRRKRLVGETITRPTIVEGKKTTIVTGNLVVNRRRIVETGPGANAAILHVRCPDRGGRVIVRGNRVINGGQILSVGSTAVAAALLVRCDRQPGAVVQVDMLNNTVINTGLIEATASP